MLNLIKTTLLHLSLLMWLTSCSEKPAVKITATLPGASKSVSFPLPPQLQATATLSPEDWQKLQDFFQFMLPRMAAVESSVLWLPQGTAVVIAKLQTQLEISGKLLETTEKLLIEAKKTREGLEKLMMPPGQ